nr:unnamed protein product [Callosobruchus analis]
MNTDRPMVSAEGTDEAPVPKRRKGIRKSSEYQRNVIKNARVIGLKCTSYKNKIKEAKQIGPNCRCLHKCFEKVDEENRISIFRNFYGMTPKKEQDIYL